MLVIFKSQIVPILAKALTSVSSRGSTALPGVALSRIAVIWGSECAHPARAEILRRQVLFIGKPREPCQFDVLVLLLCDLLLAFR